MTPGPSISQPIAGPTSHPLVPNPCAVASTTLSSIPAPGSCIYTAAAPAAMAPVRSMTFGPSISAPTLGRNNQIAEASPDETTTASALTLAATVLSSSAAAVTLPSVTLGSTTRLCAPGLLCLPRKLHLRPVSVTKAHIPLSVVSPSFSGAPPVKAIRASFGSFPVV